MWKRPCSSVSLHLVIHSKSGLFRNLALVLVRELKIVKEMGR